MSVDQDLPGLKHENRRRDSSESSQPENQAHKHNHEKTILESEVDKKPLSTISPRSAAGAEVSARLRRRLLFDSVVEQSLQTALRNLRRDFPEAEIKAFIDHEEAESAEGDIRIVLEDEFADPEDLISCEQKVQSIVRSAEVGETMLYTTVRRTDGN